MRNYFEQSGENLESYVERMLGDLYDDLFENVGVEYEDVEDVTEQVLTVALARVKSQKSSQEDK